MSRRSTSALVASRVDVRPSAAFTRWGEAVDHPTNGRIDLTMAFVGTRSVFERAGFTKAADTDAVAGGFPRVLMRRLLS